jgi:haloacetate dehalogenase
MFENFQRLDLETPSARIHLVKGGQGFPLLLLHGYPQTHVLWHKIAHRLAQHYTVIASDLRGYGDSSKPPGEADHDNYSKRVMAQDQVEVMAQLGYKEFYLVGHDRGARVAHRLTLDHPQRVKKLGLLDIAPTYQMFETTDQEFATAYYHWFFLIQPTPFPETLIGANPNYFLDHCLKSWSKLPGAFTPEAIAQYQRAFSLPDTIHSTCEDYRASATIDLVHDAQDQAHKIACPLLILWGKRGIIGKKYDVIGSWQKKANNVTGIALDCGHFLPEEAPDETYQYLRTFLT